MSDTPKSRKTTYVMLHSSDNGNLWTISGEVDALGQDAALRQFLAASDPANAGGQWVAVPVRSWQPARIETKVVTQTSIVSVQPQQVQPQAAVSEF